MPYIPHIGKGNPARRWRDKMARKFHIVSYNNTHTVYEIVRCGERAVSKCLSTKDEAKAVLAVLKGED